MKNKFTSLEILKKDLPQHAPFYTQSWVYAGISAYYSQQNQFDKLEFGNFEKQFVIKDWNGFLDPEVDNYGCVFEGHHDYWTSDEWFPAGTLLITGHKHRNNFKDYTTTGFDYWDHHIFNEFTNTTLYYEINREPLANAIYDVVIPFGSPRPHRIKFMKLFDQHRDNLTIVTDNLQDILETDLRFQQLGIEVYFNKVNLEKYSLHACYPSFFDTNMSRSLDHMPHKKMHAIAKVNVALETTVRDVSEPYCTEKTFKILAHRRPFVILGDTNILAKLKNQGFKTFANFCDESYDSEKNLDLRMQKVVQTIKQLVDSSTTHANEIDDICQHNQRLFFDRQRQVDNLAEFGKTILEII